MKQVYKLTKERHEALKEELYYLKTTREAEVAEAIKVARSFGDLSENSEYDEAKEQQAKLYSRIAELEEILSNVEIIKETKRASKADTGRRVTIMNMETGEKKEYQIVGTREANPIQGRVSDESPVGKALIGHKVGDKITLETPRGTYSYEITDIH